ncbi:MAG: hypothetical protein R3C05_16695 [Pirellulaceae bacterium]
MKQALTTSDAAATIHLVLKYYAKSNRRGSIVSSRTGHEGHQLATLMNNLAWVLSSTRPDELDRALSLVDSALAMRPEDSDFLSSGGSCFACRWENR